MVSRRTSARLFAGIVLVLLASRAWAQIPANSGLDYPSAGPSYEDGNAPFAEAAPKFKNFWPFKPGHVGTDAQPFGPAQTSEYGNGPRPNVGWWGSYERLFWSLSKPDTSFVGAPPINSFPYFGTSPQTIDNSFIEAIGAWGNRWEFGYMDNDNYGWEVSVLDHICQGQFQVVDIPRISFGDPLGLLEAMVTVPLPNTNPQQFETFDLGQLPATFRQLEMKSITTLNGVEAMRQYRAPRLHNGGYFEVSYGARFFQIDDAFSVKGFGNFAGTLVGTILGTGFNFPLNILDQSTWGTRVQDNLVGAQIGLRWFRQQGHWLTSVEGRFMAAANFENVNQVTSMGTRIVENVRANQSANATELFNGVGTRTHETSTVFSPMGELRLNVSYVVTSNVNLKVGYNGLVVGNVSRASNRVDYNSPNLVGILPKSNNEIFFVNGLSFGVEVNR